MGGKGGGLMLLCCLSFTCSEDDVLRCVLFLKMHPINSFGVVS